MTPIGPIKITAKGLELEVSELTITSGSVPLAGVKMPKVFEPLECTIQFNQRVHRQIIRSIGLTYCEHCADHALWRLAHMVTFSSKPCRYCLDECLERGITIKRLYGGKVSVCRPLETKMETE